MDGFTYYNIFETKGIEYILTIVFFATIIPFWFILNKQKIIKQQFQKALGILTANILKIPQGLFYSKNHTWTHLEKSGIAKVGLNDLLLHITGKINITNLKKQGEMIEKGDVLTEISQNGKILQIQSPISGEILDTNQNLYENPGIINDDPYGIGWIYNIKPTNWIKETNSYYFAKEATNWLTKELERFKDFLAVSIKKHVPELSIITLQDGGELIDNTLKELPKGVWQDFQKEFLSIT